jgi:hypothetical protein
MFIDRLFNGLAQVLPQMKPVGHLNGLRRTSTSALSVSAGSVTANYFNFWMVTKPNCQRLTIPPIEDIDRLAGFQVHQDRSISMSAAKRKVVDTEYADRKTLGLGNVAIQRGAAGSPARLVDR